MEPDHSTVWEPNSPHSTWSPLGEDDVADVCVVGGGIAGLTTAFLLAQDGLSVVLVEAGAMGGGETSRTSAHLASALDDRFHELERLHGARGAQIAAASHAAAIDFIESACRTQGIVCDFQRVPGYLFAPDEAGVAELARELPAARRAGLAVDRLERVPGLPFDSGPCLCFPAQAQFHPMQYLHGLATRAAALGARLHGRTRAVDISGGRDAGVRTDGGHRISARAVVVATNVPVNDRVAVQTRLEAYRSYCIAINIPRGSLPQALYWDTGDPYHYVRVVEGRPSRHHDLLVVGGEDHKVGQGPADPDEPYARLETWTRARLPAAEAVACRWSGQIIEPVDSLALIGRNPMDADNVYIIAGDSGNGLTHGTLGAMLVRDLLRGRDNPWAELYRPSRLTLGAAGEYALHNANVLGQYADWVSGGDVRSLDDVEPGTGAVVRHGVTKWAAYRDPAGHLHVCSAVCPHLGGMVRWNAGERTWDCPCHGSRFDAYGKVVNGPANTDLDRVDVAIHGPQGVLA